MVHGDAFSIFQAGTANTIVSLHNHKGTVKEEGYMEAAYGIVIVGGGICGLATALALHRKGIASIVLEKSETLRADGAAIGIYVNGWRVLEQLGVAAELRETANGITAHRNVWQQGNKTTQVPVRNEFRCLKRKDLIETLAKNIPAGSIRFGCHIVAIHEDPGTHGAVLTSLDGSTIRAKKTFSDDTYHPGATTDDVSAVKDLALQKLKEFPTEFADMVRDSEPGSLNVVTRLWYRPPWQVAFGALQKGAVTVAGDAMHAMGPFIGQGGAAGLEDAVVLARALSRAAGGELCDDDDEKKKMVQEAIAEYVTERRWRVAMLSLECFVMGTLLRSKSIVTKLACVAMLLLLGSKSLRHTNYDCGHL
ncbi:hypothetical protein EJB05_21246, partial [Eragrostis curvula]